MSNPTTTDTPSVPHRSIQPPAGLSFPMKYPLFVYGTLKRGESNYSFYLAGRTTCEQLATLICAALYTEGRYPYLVAGAGLTGSAEQVYGTLMTIHPDHYIEVMQHIDGLEDYTPGDPNNWYERVIQTVQIAEGPIEAWTYVAGTKVLTAIQAGRYMKIPGGMWSEATERSRRQKDGV